MQQLKVENSPLIISDYTKNHISLKLGKISSFEMKSSMSPFWTFSKFKTVYPKVVTQALVELYREYNQVFTTLVEKNREWDTDYQYCYYNNLAISNLVRIDMVGLPDSFLQAAQDYSLSEVIEVLRGVVFEFESTTAMYQLLERIFPQSPFKTDFRYMLNSLRKKINKPIALLAVTEEKYELMLQKEFGRNKDNPPASDEVMELTGFDAFWGPKQFLEHFDSNGGECSYLLYVRASNPDTKLRKPKEKVVQPLLSDERIRRIVKANALTMNIDNPDDQMLCKINDTKAYMTKMGMGYRIESIGDVLSEDFIRLLEKNKNLSDFNNSFFTDSFYDYLNRIGVSINDAYIKKCLFRTKPLYDCHGSYGHSSGSFSEREFRQTLKNSLKYRGPQILQPELSAQKVTNSDDGKSYTYIDRNFLTIHDDELKFVCGFRCFMPLDTMEGSKGRIHGNSNTVWSEITSI